jgi:hypothetical protein
LNEGGRYVKDHIQTQQQLYHWIVLPFDLPNALATFMRVIDDILPPYIDSFVMVYLDDILVLVNLGNIHVFSERGNHTLSRHIKASKISLVLANQAKILVNENMKFVLLFPIVGNITIGVVFALPLCMYIKCNFESH